MRKRHRIVLLVLAALVALAGTATAQELKVNVTVTWDLGLRVGVDYRPWDHVGFVADIGSTLFSLEGAFVLTGDAFVAVHAFPPDRPLQLSALVGIPDVRVIFISPPAGEIAFGVSGQAAYAVGERLDLFARVGGGVPFFLEEGEFGYRDIDFPLGLWPDVSLGLKFGLR
jgi:hypothetical protein